MTVDYRQAADLLRQCDKVLLLTHKRPDGDTIGCAVALCHALRALGKTAWLLPDFDATSLFTPYLEGVLAPEDFCPQFVVSVDIAGLGLLPENAKKYRDCIDLAIDHHPSNEGFARENCVETDKAACGEIVYQIIACLTTLTAEIALPLYVAVSTDTGCFVYSNTTAHTHLVAAELLAIGIDYKRVNKRHFRTKSLKRLQLEAMLLSEMHLYEGDTLVVAAITLDMMARVGAAEEDVEDIAAFLGQIEGVRHSVTIRQLAPEECKLSVRTAADLNASQVCELLGGGGHAAAAGCTLAMTPQQAERAIVAAVGQVKHGT